MKIDFDLYQGLIQGGGPGGPDPLLILFIALLMSLHSLAVLYNLYLNYYIFL